MAQQTPVSGRNGSGTTGNGTGGADTGPSGTDPGTPGTDPETPGTGPEAAGAETQANGTVDLMELGSRLGTLETKIDHTLSWKGGWGIAAAAGGTLITLAVGIWFSFIEPRFTDRHTALTGTVDTIETDLKTVTARIGAEARALETLVRQTEANITAAMQGIGTNMRSELQVAHTATQDNDTRISALERNTAKIEQLSQQVARLEGSMSQFRQQVRADLASAAGLAAANSGFSVVSVLPKDDGAYDVYLDGKAIDDPAVAAYLAENSNTTELVHMMPKTWGWGAPYDFKYLGAGGIIDPAGDMKGTVN